MFLESVSDVLEIGESTLIEITAEQEILMNLLSGTFGELNQMEKALNLTTLQIFDTIEMLGVKIQNQIKNLVS